MADYIDVAKKPVSVNKLGKLLLTSVRDVAGLCKHKNIKKWSRYKPFRSSRLFFDQDSKDESEFFKGGDRSDALKTQKYGLQLPIICANAEATKTDANAWAYLRPTGGSNSPYRLSDFIQYYHKASCPIIYKGDVSVEALFDTEIMLFSTNSITQLADYLVPFDELMADMDDAGSYGIAIYLTWTSGGSSKACYKVVGLNDVSHLTVAEVHEQLTDAVGSCNYYLVLCNDKDKTTFNASAKAGARWRTMPFDKSINEAMGKITISSGRGSVKVTVNKIGKTIGGEMKDFLPYSAPGSSMFENDSEYFNIYNGYTVILECTIKNSSSRQITINESELKAVAIGRNFAGVNVTSSNRDTYKVNVSMYDASNVHISYISVPANGEKTVRLLIPRGAFLPNGSSASVASGQNLPITLNLYIDKNNGAMSDYILSQIMGLSDKH